MRLKEWSLVKWSLKSHQNALTATYDQLQGSSRHSVGQCGTLGGDQQLSAVLRLRTLFICVDTWTTLPADLKGNKRHAYKAPVRPDDTMKKPRSWPTSASFANWLRRRRHRHLMWLQISAALYSFLGNQSWLVPFTSVHFQAMTQSTFNEGNDGSFASLFNALTHVVKTSCKALRDSALKYFSLRCKLLARERHVRPSIHARAQNLTTRTYANLVITYLFTSPTFRDRLRNNCLLIRFLQKDY